MTEHTTWDVKLHIDWEGGGGSHEHLSVIADCLEDACDIARKVMFDTYSDGEVQFDSVERGRTVHQLVPESEPVIISSWADPDA